MVTEFRNEAVLDFSKPENREGMEKAIQEVRSKFGRTYDLVIGGRRIKTEETFPSINPSNPSEIIGHFAKATAKEADQALFTATEAFPMWAATPAADRAEVLFRAAEGMRARRFEMDAWMVLETGKSWIEADADTAESIDFLEFYGREMLRYAEKQPITPIAGEQNEMFYIPLGVGVIIPPWNFPNAILCGMSAGALVTGNTVVLKPSSDSPGIGYVFMEIMEKAGIPPGVLNFLSGPGRLAGDHLVRHPKTRFIAFTGSMEVGLGIVEKAAKTEEGQIWIKRVIAEMGGKDGIVVSRTADLDAAVKGVVASAFGFQGQKCSACSRAVVDASIYDKFLEGVKEEVAKLTIGPPEQYGIHQGPVINEKAMNSILEYIEIGKGEGKLICGGKRAEGEGFFIEPTVIANVDSKARISQEEIFGPVLAVTRSWDFDEAIRIANDTIYGLTGSVYTADEKEMAKARHRFHVGNLYINRKSTGAMVGGHPFGGFNMSGTDSKAGGRDYLLLFLQAKSVSRKIG